MRLQLVVKDSAYKAAPWLGNVWSKVKLMGREKMKVSSPWGELPVGPVWEALHLGHSCQPEVAMSASV